METEAAPLEALPVPSSPDGYVHMFRTFLGIPPAKGESPVCGAVLTDAYDFPAVARPVCPACQAVADGEAR